MATFSTGNFTLVDESDKTKAVAFDASGLTTGTVRKFSWPDADGMIARTQDVVGLVYPVGSIFLSVVSTNPGTLLGVGTWVAIGTGRTLVAIDSGDTDFDVVEETGGAKTAASSAQTFAGTPSTVVVNHVHTLATGTGSTGNFAQGVGTADSSPTRRSSDLDPRRALRFLA